MVQQLRRPETGRPGDGEAGRAVAVLIPEAQRQALTGGKSNG